MHRYQKTDRVCGRKIYLHYLLKNRVLRVRQNFHEKLEDCLSQSQHFFGLLVLSEYREIPLKQGKLDILPVYRLFWQYHHDESVYLKWSLKYSWHIIGCISSVLEVV